MEYREPGIENGEPVNGQETLTGSPFSILGSSFSILRNSDTLASQPARDIGRRLPVNGSSTRWYRTSVRSPAFGCVSVDRMDEHER
jgi:hypothetical protein